jgi:hypothetical protein
MMMAARRVWPPKRAQGQNQIASGVCESVAHYVGQKSVRIGGQGRTHGVCKKRILTRASPTRCASCESLARGGSVPSPTREDFTHGPPVRAQYTSDSQTLSCKVERNTHAETAVSLVLPVRAFRCPQLGRHYHHFLKYRMTRAHSDICALAAVFAHPRASNCRHTSPTLRDVPRRRQRCAQTAVVLCAPCICAWRAARAPLRFVVAALLACDAPRDSPPANPMQISIRRTVPPLTLTVRARTALALRAVPAHARDHLHTHPPLVLLRLRFLPATTPAHPP